MEFKTALGFLGLIAIAVLVLIYLLKPNYQQKVISSTFLWKLSLKYKRKRIPVNRIRQVLLFICQILLLTTAAIILTQPHLLNTAELPQNEKILVIDGSASMLASYDEQTRFERAVELAKRDGEQAIDAGGIVTVILADDTAGYARTDSGKTASRLTDKIQLFQALDNMTCTYGRADINGAMRLAEDILVSNHTADTALYTATVYQGVDDVVKIVDVSVRDDDGQWLERNAAILSAEAKFIEGYFQFEIEVANYNNDDAIQLTIVIDNPVYNIGEGQNYKTGKRDMLRNVKIVPVTAGERTKVVFANLYDEENNTLRVYEYSKVSVNISVEYDTFSYDDSFYIYGGKKEQIKIMYVSTQPEDFVNRSLETLRPILSHKWDITADTYNFLDDPVFTGYDFYIFEHRVPQGGRLPTDGVSILIDPNIAPLGGDFMLVSTPRSGDDFVLSPSESEVSGGKKLTRGLTPGNITVSKYKRALDISDDVQQIMGYKYEDSFDPMLLVKNTKDSRYAVLTFDLHYSNLPVLLDFPVMMINLFEYFIPTTITKTTNEIDVPCFVFDVNEEITINARGTSINVIKGVEEYAKIDSFPHALSIDKPGEYVVDQILLNAKTVTERFFVRVSAEESNFNRMDTFIVPAAPKARPGLDLILYISAVLVGLLFIERILYIREEF